MNCTIRVGGNKGADRLGSYCVFVFAYAYCWFSGAAAHQLLFMDGHV